LKPKIELTLVFGNHKFAGVKILARLAKERAGRPLKRRQKSKKVMYHPPQIAGSDVQWPIAFYQMNCDPPKKDCRIEEHRRLS